MPTFNLTVPDTSPLITYTGTGWFCNTVDPDFVKHLNETFHASKGFGDSATFTFNGTGFSLFGSKRFNHGPYHVIVDGRTVGSGNGTSAQDLFDQMIFGMGSLPYGEHTISLVNDGSGNNDWMDLDAVLLETGDGNANSTTHDVMLDDGAKNITYSGDWGPTPSSRIMTSPGYYNGTGTSATTPGAVADVSFHGSAVTLWGATNDMFSVSIDGAPAKTYNVTEDDPVTRPNAILFFAAGLSDGPHALHVMKLGNADDTSYLDLDQVQVSTSTHPTTSPTSASTKKTAAIIGGVTGVVVLTLMFGFFFFLRRRKQQRQWPRVIVPAIDEPPSPQPIDEFLSAMTVTPYAVPMPAPSNRKVSSRSAEAEASLPPIYEEAVPAVVLRPRPPLLQHQVPPRKAQSHLYYYKGRRPGEG